MTDLQQGPLHDRHVALGAKLADFGGWEMPIEYPGGGVLKEHLAVREDAGERTGITTLSGGDPVATRAALLERGLLVSAVPASRSDDLAGPVLRVSTAAWVRPEDVDALATALAH